MKHSSEPLDVFQGDHYENQFVVISDPKHASRFYIHNPETLIEVYQIENDENSEALYINKRYAEALELTNKSTNKY